MLSLLFFKLFLIYLIGVSYSTGEVMMVAIGRWPADSSEKSCRGSSVLKESLRPPCRLCLNQIAQHCPLVVCRKSIDANKGQGFFIGFITPKTFKL